MSRILILSLLAFFGQISAASERAQFRKLYLDAAFGSHVHAGADLEIYSHYDQDLQERGKEFAEKQKTIRQTEELNFYLITFDEMEPEIERPLSELSSHEIMTLVAKIHHHLAHPTVFEPGFIPFRVRPGAVEVNGKIRRVLAPGKIKQEFSEFVDRLSEKLKELHHGDQDDNEQKRKAIEAAAFAHQNIVRIHPFNDYNGRTARIFTNLILFQHLKIMVNFPNAKQYNEAVRNEVDSDNVRGFSRFLSEVVEKCKYRCLNLLSDEASDHKHCEICGKKTSQGCSRCRHGEDCSVFYCTMACQKLHWVEHKQLCKNYLSKHKNFQLALQQARRIRINRLKDLEKARQEDSLKMQGIFRDFKEYTRFKDEEDITTSEFEELLGAFEIETSGSLTMEESMIYHGITSLNGPIEPVEFPDYP